MKDQTGRGLFRFVTRESGRRTRRYLRGTSAVVLLTIGSTALLQVPGVVGVSSAFPSPHPAASVSPAREPASTGGPSVVGASSTFTSSKTTMARTSIPTGTGSGDVLVSLINTTAATTVTCPAGWTLAYSAANGSSTQLVSCIDVVGGSTPVAKATLSPAAPVAMITTAFSGISPTSPIDGAGAVKGDLPPNITTSGTGDLLVLGEGSNAPKVSPSAPAGAQLLTTVTNGSHSQSAVATETVASPGSVSSPAWSTQPSTSTAVTGLLALAPSTASPTLTPQAIAFTSTPPANPTVGGSYTVTATGGASGSPVTFSVDASSSVGACSLSGSAVSFAAAGTCVIDANQAATGSYSAAPQVQQSFVIAPSSGVTDFNQMAPGTWTQGQEYGGWIAVFNGYGSIGVTSDPGVGNVLTLSPEVSTSPSETHSALVRSASTQGDLNYSVRVQTVKQLRQGSAPNPWEVGWVFWHYTDNTHFYYFILKPNGWELGKEDPAYPGNQRFLATGSSPSLVIGTWHTIAVQQTGATMTVSVDGSPVVTFTDTQNPYTSGSVAMYCEDSTVNFSDPSITPLG